MVECFEFGCKHFAFKGQTAFCKVCDVLTPKNTGKKCARCKGPILLRRHEIPMQWLCLACSEVAAKLNFGLATDANIQYCYYIATGELRPVEFVRTILNKSFLMELTPEERKFYDKAVEGYDSLPGHSLAGQMWSLH